MHNIYFSNKNYHKIEYLINIFYLQNTDDFQNFQLNNNLYKTFLIIIYKTKTRITLRPSHRHYNLPELLNSKLQL